MKKTSWVFALILLLSLSLCPPAAAVTEYGVIYDETESLGSQTLGMQGEETLPQLTEYLGIDLRVDVLTLIDDDSIGDTAAWIYEEYGYGYGEKEYGYGFEDDGEKTGHKHSKHKHGDKGEPANTESIENIPDSEIPDNNAE